LFGFDDSSDLLGPFNDFFGIVRKFCKRPHFFSHYRWKERRHKHTESRRCGIENTFKVYTSFHVGPSKLEEHLEKSSFDHAPVSSFLCHQDFSIKDLS
jgi:hypothetical protein